MPLSVTVNRANRHDKKLVKEISDTTIIQKPSSDSVIQNICVDKGYDFPDIRQMV
jgi:putative transposase